MESQKLWQNNGEVRIRTKMGIFCKHQYGKVIVGKSPVVDNNPWSVVIFYYVRIRAFKTCGKCGKELVISDERSRITREELEEFTEEHYIEGTSVVKEEYSSSA